nr:MAG TPA: Protein of unknown function (DUF806) [Caudoviricetes sp.]
MIDIENIIYTTLKKVLVNECKLNPQFISTEIVLKPKNYPWVTIIEMMNIPYSKTQTNDDIENHAEVVYEINVYTNDKNGKKSRCKKIISTVDTKMKNLGFRRIMLSPIPNANDPTIYRIIARYEAIVSKENKEKYTIYRR